MRNPPFLARTGLAVFRRGNGRPVVFLHGWCLNSSLWTYAEESLAGTAETLSLDLAGFGRSSHLPGPYGIARHAADLLEALAELELRDVVLVGFAYGAAVGLAAAAEDGTRISGIVSVGVPSAAASLPYERMPKAMRRDWPEFARRSAAALFHNEQSDATRRWVEDMFRSAPLTPALEVVGELARFEPVDVAAKVSCRQLYIHGADDPVASVATGEACVRASRNSAVSVLDSCGHLIPIDSKDAFHGALAEFLAGG
ncbi:alpha/beta fold hydrolase [Amorphus sp. MBR-141]